MKLGLDGARAFVNTNDRTTDHWVTGVLAAEGALVFDWTTSKRSYPPRADSRTSRGAGSEPLGILHQAVQGLGGLDLLVVGGNLESNRARSALSDEHWELSMDRAIWQPLRTIRAARVALVASERASVLVIVTMVECPEADPLAQPIPAMLQGAIQSLAHGLSPIRFNGILSTHDTPETLPTEPTLNRTAALATFLLSPASGSVTGCLLRQGAAHRAGR